MSSLKKPIILITGVSSGIGLTLAQYLLKSGRYKIIGSVRKKEDAKVLEDSFPKDFKTILLDVCNSESITASFHQVKSFCASDGLYALINNAGIAIPGPLKEMPISDFEKQMDVNVNSIIRVTNTFLPLLGTDHSLNRNPGRIINVGSISGLFLTPFLGAYCISKHAVENISDMYRMELGIYGIKVTTIEPGPIKTNIWDKSLEYKDQYLETDYGKVWKTLPSRTKKSEENALSADVLCRKVEKILKMKQPGKRYIIDRNKFSKWIAAYMIPRSLLQRIMRIYLTKALKS